VDIVAWLRELGLERYEQAFRRNEIDAEILPKLTADDLKDIGVTIVGHRRKLLEAIAALAEPASARGAESTPAEPAAGARRAEAERRQLTVMFVDLVGSTALSAKLDPEDMREVIRGYQNAVAAEITRYDGHVAKYMGDGVIAYFGYPKAHEDEAERAVRAGLATTDAIGRLNNPTGEPLAARIGIATGLVVVGDLVGEGAAQEQAVVGDTPNLAARLQGIAAPNQVVVAEATRRLLGAGFELENLGTRMLKGIGEPVKVFAVTGERPVESRFEARAGPSLLPMVGRDQELALLLERWAQAEAGEGQGVLLVGEAGIGKSRIVRALLDALAEEPHTRIRYQCSPYHCDSALWPVIQQLTRAADLVAADPSETRLDKLEALLAQAGDTTAAAPLIADLLALDGVPRYGRLDLTAQAQRMRTLAALVGQMLGLAARQPVLVILEDAHWIDPTTLELIEQGLNRIAAARVLILLTSRPDQQPAFAAHPHVTRLALNRLGRAGVEAIVARLGGDRLPGGTIDTIIARTDGVPLFVEELTKAVLETGDTAIPASLHDTLMARLDRIPEVKEVAQVAACIGREFDFSLLAAVADKPEQALATALDRLTDAELIFRRGRPPDATYIFKHVLVRDVAYGSLLKQSARQIHRRTAAALLDQAPDHANPPHDLVATHLLAAGRERASLPHMLAAAKVASERYAYPEALSCLARAEATLGNLGRDEALRQLEMDLCVTLTPILMAVQGYTAPKTVATAERAIQLCAELEDYDRLLPMLFARLSGHSAAGEIHAALEVAERIRGIGTTRDNLIAKVVGYRTVGFCRLWMGQLEAASESLTYAVELSDDLPGHDFRFGQDPKITARVLLACTKHFQGHLDLAISLARNADEQAMNSKHPLTTAYVTMYRCSVAADRREFDNLILMSSTFESVCKNYKIVQFEELGSFYAAWGRFMSGEEDVSCDDLEIMLERHWERVRLNRPNHLRMLAAAFTKAGRFERAMQLIDEASEIMATLGELWVEPELLRWRAQLLQHQAGDRTLAAERYLRESCDAAAAQGARLTQLRAARDLARLWTDQGHRKEAHDLLAPIYGWFTEGFDTADLKDAKALLDELA